ncbi:MAG: hypothetical protein HDT46_09070 [Ruminococcaceae bacterium]|nr:hypothetical protein [Oscillospiraceae bacterium]MBD5116483.1 hypothetical protein [Oscillospiraceae bacterium]
MNVGKIAEYTTPTPAASPKSTVEQSAKKNTTTAADRPNTDRYEVKSEASYTPAYTKASSKTKSETEPNKNKGMNIQKPSSRVAMKNEAFKSMVSDIIGKQSGLAFNAIMKDADKIQNGTIDDYWSAEQTAQRIYDFARTLAGDDDSKLETLRKAVQTGFKQAGATFSKNTGMSGLPSICQDTYKQVMDKFDDWAKESKGSSTSSSSKSDSTFKPSGYSVTNDEKKAYKNGSSSTANTSSKSTSGDFRPSGYSVTNDEKKAYKS